MDEKHIKAQVTSKVHVALILDNSSEQREGREAEPTLEDWKILLTANRQSIQEEIATCTEKTVENSNSDEVHQNFHQM